MKRCYCCFSEYDDEAAKCPKCGYFVGSDPDISTHLKPGTVLNDKYIIGQAVGSGGFGVTYAAWDEILQMKVAVKEYMPGEFSTRVSGNTQILVYSGDKEEQFAEGLKKFSAEGRRLIEFRNLSGVVKVYDTCEANGTAYLIMEYIEGITISELLEGKTLDSEFGQSLRVNNGKMAPEDAIRLLEPVAAALSQMHAQGLIHRDISPDNIMITKNGDVKLIDFGAARYATVSHSRSLTVIIRQGYSPEEQYRSSGDQGSHTDVYALCAVFYKMITGVTPPDALERRASVEMGRKDLLKPPTKLVPGLSRNIETAILNAMNCRIADRTATIDRFMAEIKAAGNVELAQVTIKKKDKNKAPFILKLLVLVLIMLPVAGIFMILSGRVTPGDKEESVVSEKQVLVPDFTGMTVEEAQSAAGLDEIVVKIYGQRKTNEYEAGRIVSQNIKKTYVSEKTEVYVIVAAAKDDVIDVVNMTKDDARAVLDAAGILTIIKYESSDMVEEGTVIRTEPEILSGVTQAILYVSSGSK